VDLVALFDYTQRFPLFSRNRSFILLTLRFVSSQWPTKDSQGEEQGETADEIGLVSILAFFCRYPLETCISLAVWWVSSAAHRVVGSPFRAMVDWLPTESNSRR